MAVSFAKMLQLLTPVRGKDKTASGRQNGSHGVRPEEIIANRLASMARIERAREARPFSRHLRQVAA